MVVALACICDYGGGLGVRASRRLCTSWPREEDISGKGQAADGLDQEKQSGKNE